MKLNIKKRFKNWQDNIAKKNKEVELSDRKQLVLSLLLDNLETEESILIFSAAEKEFQEILNERLKRLSEERTAIINFKKLD